jgi:hypothetical protein
MRREFESRPSQFFLGFNFKQEIIIYCLIFRLYDRTSMYTIYSRVIFFIIVIILNYLQFQFHFQLYLKNNNESVK